MKTLEKIDVISLAKIQALIGFILGFLFAILNFMVEKFTTLPKEMSIEPLGASLIIISPIIGLFYGFIGGLVIAFFYNTLSKFVGGIKLELKEK